MCDIVVLYDLWSMDMSLLDMCGQWRWYVWSIEMSLYDMCGQWRCPCMIYVVSGQWICLCMLCVVIRYVLEWWVRSMEISLYEMCGQWGCLCMISVFIRDVFEWLCGQWRYLCMMCVVSEMLCCCVWSTVMFLFDACGQCSCLCVMYYIRSTMMSLCVMWYVWSVEMSLCDVWRQCIRSWVTRGQWSDVCKICCQRRCLFVIFNDQRWCLSEMCVVNGNVFVWNAGGSIGWKDGTMLSLYAVCEKRHLVSTQRGDPPRDHTTVIRSETFLLFTTRRRVNPNDPSQTD
jgi:hypothetical protein